MNSLWKEQDAQHFLADGGELGLRVYSSRLLGKNERLVLAGGGNTSVKVTERNVLGKPVSLIYVKGSGWDLSSIEALGFAGVQMDHCLSLLDLPELSDASMVNELKLHCTLHSAPTPSVETLLHACLPFKYVDHTHADAIVTVTNLPDGESRIREIYGERVLCVPYVMPGFDLAKYCSDLWKREGNDDLLGMILLNHGIFSWGKDARESYERMITLVSEAEDYLGSKGQEQVLHPVPQDEPAASSLDPQELASIRKSISNVAGHPLLIRSNRTARALEYAGHPTLPQAHRRGTATPDHVIRVKRSPLIGRDVKAYAKNYRESFERNAALAQSSEKLEMLDPAPRIVLDPQLGLLSAGRKPEDCRVAEAIALHTFDVVEGAESLGKYQPVGELDLFRMEYWELEQAKLAKPSTTPPFTGEVALITGSCSGIGKACVHAFRARGAVVTGLDLLEDQASDDYLPMVVDVTDSAEVEKALSLTIDAYGGLDVLVLNAGLFPPSSELGELSDDLWERTLSVNLHANQRLLRLAYPFLRQAPSGGRVLIVGSKNVPAPGPGAAAYSASKAALTQLARVASLEWASDNIRVNVLHPNSVFDTNLWTPEILAKRAAAYGLTEDEYKRRNLLQVEVTSMDVAEAAAELCGPRFAKTTGAQLPVDGGEERVV